MCSLLSVFHEGPCWVDPGEFSILCTGHLGSRSQAVQAGEFRRASEKGGGEVG